MSCGKRRNGSDMPKVKSPNALYAAPVKPLFPTGAQIQSARRHHQTDSQEYRVHFKPTAVIIWAGAIS
jgi:hypothetical protein